MGGYTRTSKLVTDDLLRLPKQPAYRFPHPAPAGYPCGVCGEPIEAGEKYQCSVGTLPRDVAEDRRTDWFHADHDRFGWEASMEKEEREAHERKQLATILERGGLITLGTPEARQAWTDGIPTLVSAVMAHFTPEERAIIVGGTE